MATRRNLVHCAYHKCLTVYFAIVLNRVYNELLPGRGGYRHFNSFVEDFYENLGRYRVLSVNNHSLDLALLGDFRITRFVRDPRDLIVSGYLYHRRGAEEWCKIQDPTAEDWKIVNGKVPEGMTSGHSYATYLESLPEEEGLLAEIEFRKHHFRSMMQWPEDDPRILTFRYEDVMGREARTFGKILSFYGVPWTDRLLGAVIAHRYSARELRKKTTHIRNPEPNQWKKRFTPRVTRAFMDLHGGLVEKLGYDS